MLEKRKTDVDGLLLVLIRKKNFGIFSKIELFFISETKCSRSTSVFIFSAIFKILKTKFYVVWILTCRNLKSIKFPNLSHALKGLFFLSLSVDSKENF